MGSLTGSPVLYLVRHGAIEAAYTRKFVGQSDARLSGEGLLQAERLRGCLRDTRFSQIFHTGLDRSRATAAIIAGDQNSCTIECAGLREISLGEWEGRDFDEIADSFPEAFQSRRVDIEHWRPPGGESFADCWQRVQTTLEDILKKAAGNVLIAGHAGVNRLILCQALGLPVANLLRIGQDYGCLNVIDYSDRGWRVQVLNYTPAALPPDQRWKALKQVPVAQEEPSHARRLLG